MEKNTLSDKKEVLSELNNWCKSTLIETLDIKFTDVGEYFLEAEMPINEKTIQPEGVLHGGASAALLESVGSGVSIVFMDRERKTLRGIDLSISHLKSGEKGKVIARAEIVHKGQTIHYVVVSIRDEQGNLISRGKITNILLDRKDEK